MIEIRNKYITRPGQLASPFNHDDGIGLAIKGEKLLVEDCIVDFEGVPLSEQQDGGVDITWGSSAVFIGSVFRNVGKLSLIGSGDKGRREDENGKTVLFQDCLFENCGRRAPEVQCGMQCFMERCAVLAWGDPKCFTVRAFGAWAHDGGFIHATDCVFMNENRMTFRQRVADIWHHFWQALADNGLSALTASMTYKAGWRRGLTASDTGMVVAKRCFAGPGIIVQGKYPFLLPMPAREAFEQVERLRNMYAKLLKTTERLP